MRAKSIIILVLGLLLGLSVSLFANRAGIELNVMMKYYLVGAIFIIVAVFTVGLLRMLQFKKKSDLILPILYEEKDTKRFIKETIQLINKSPRITQNLLEMALAAGYSADGDDSRAIQILNSVDPRNLADENQAVYYINQFAFTYNIGNEMEAIRILEEHKELLERYENHPFIGGAFAINMVYRYMAEQDYDNAKFFLEKANEKCSLPYLRDTIEYLNVDILIHENNLEEGLLLLQQLKQKNPTPSLLRKIIKSEEAMKKTTS